MDRTWQQQGWEQHRCWLVMSRLEYLLDKLVIVEKTGSDIRLLVYAYYHFSGLKAFVDKARAAKSKYDHVHIAWSENKPRTPSEAVAFLRRISRSGSGPVPDSFVDMVAQFQGSHEEDIDRIVFGAVDDIQAIIAESRAAAAVDGVETVGEEGLTAQDRVKIASIVQKRARELREYIREKKLGPEDGKSRFKVAERFRARHGDNQPISEEAASK